MSGFKWFLKSCAMATECCTKLKVFGDWNFTVHVNNKDISRADLGIPKGRLED